ncbi:hypothetical protein CC79DRAFT_1366973 [Sarocladium strictum]
MSTNQAFVQFTYPASAASDFNLDYYLNTHVPLLKSRWEDQGLRQCIISVGEKGASYHVQATLIWDSLESFKNAGFVEEITGDVKNFTSSTPSSTVAKIVSSSNASA